MLEAAFHLYTVAQNLNPTMKRDAAHAIAGVGGEVGGVNSRARHQSRPQDSAGTKY
jgi:hypothetical protein